MLLQSGQEVCVVRSLTNRILLKMLLAIRIHWNPLPKHWVELRHVLCCGQLLSHSSGFWGDPLSARHCTGHRVIPR